MSRIRLITRADDLGLFPCVDDAALDAFHHGILRNAGIMVPAPNFAYSTQVLQNVPGLCLGIHATINCEWEWPRWGSVLPAAEAGNLLEADGTMHTLPIDVHEAGVSLEILAKELRAQLATARAAGLQIGYLDNHCGFDWLHEYALLRFLVDFCEEENLVMGNSKWTHLPKVEGDFATRADRLIAQLDAAEPGTYLIVIHPGLEDDNMRRLRMRGAPEAENGKVARERYNDYLLYKDAKLMDYAANHGVEFIRYTDITPAERSTHYANLRRLVADHRKAKGLV